MTVPRYFDDDAGEHRFAVDGANGENLATSEGYTRPRDAERGFAALVARLTGPGSVTIPADDARALAEHLELLPGPVGRQVRALPAWAHLARLLEPTTPDGGA